MKKTASSVSFRVKRIYDPVEAGDGLRVLIDRLWPRGVSRERAAVGLWLKEVTPSTELRQWLHSEPEGWPEFARRYRLELAQQPEAVAQLLKAARSSPVTLLSTVKDFEHSHVSVLVGLLQKAAEQD